EEGRLREVDVASPEQAGQVPVEEREEQRRDVLTVAVGVHQEEDAAVAQLRLVEVFPEPAAERAHDVLELLVPEDLAGGRLLRVQHLPAERQDRLRPPIAALL